MLHHPGSHNIFEYKARDFLSHLQTIIQNASDTLAIGLVVSDHSPEIYRFGRSTDNASEGRWEPDIELIMQSAFLESILAGSDPSPPIGNTVTLRVRHAWTQLHQFAAFLTNGDHKVKPSRSIGFEKSLTAATPAGEAIEIGSDAMFFPNETEQGVGPLLKGRPRNIENQNTALESFPNYSHQTPARTFSAMDIGALRLAHWLKLVYGKVERLNFDTDTGGEINGGIVTGTDKDGHSLKIEAPQL